MVHIFMKNDVINSKITIQKITMQGQAVPPPPP